MLKVKLIPITEPRNSAHLNVDNGSEIVLTEYKEGFRIAGFNSQFEKSIQTAHGIMKRRRNALRTLAE